MTLKKFEEILNSTSQNPKQYLSDSQKIIKHYLERNDIAGAYHFAKGLTLEDSEIQLFMNQSLTKYLLNINKQTMISKQRIKIDLMTILKHQL